MSKTNIPIKTDSLAGKLRLSIVPRWSIISMSRPQSVAEHTYNVMVIVDHILNNYFQNNVKAATGVGREYMFQYTIEHDLDEILTGDIPSINKPPSNCCPVVKLADSMEAYVYAYKYCNDSERIKRWVLSGLYEKMKYYAERCQEWYDVNVDWVKIVKEALDE